MVACESGCNTVIARSSSPRIIGSYYTLSGVLQQGCNGTYRILQAVAAQEWTTAIGGYRENCSDGDRELDDPR
jgi:hypothetical protein